MKKILLFAAVSFLATSAFSQKYDEIKNMLMLPGGFAKAKQSFDKQSSNEKFYAKPDGYLLKAALYGQMSLDSAMASEADKNRNEAYEAFMKYKEADPAMKLVTPDDMVYRNVPFNLYASYFNSGVADINDKKYEPAYEKFQKTVELSDVLIEKKIATFTFDTNAVYYAGILAETVQKPEEALKYNTRFADLKIGGAGFESVYQTLVRYYALKNDQANFEKYRVLGKELYPNSEFFTYNIIDFAVGASGGFHEKIANLEKIIASNPEDYKAQLTLAEAIYDTLDSRREGAVLPANYDELETKMIKAFNKASSLKPEELQPLLLTGNHYITKSERIGDEMRPIETEVIKKGAKATASDKQRLAEAQAKYDAVYDLSRDYFEKAAELYAKMGTLNAVDKRNYRIIVGNLAQYYSYKRESAKGAELNKIIALETKYNNLYDKLR